MKLNKITFLFLIVIILVGLTINLLPVIKGIFPVTYDQGRDFLWVKNQLDFRQPSLVGPIGSLNGVFFGPLWFWLLAIPSLLFNGSPLAMTLFNTLIVYLSVILAAFLFKSINRSTAYFILLLGAISPAIHGLANHAFSQHLLPLLTILLIYSFTRILLQPSRLHFILSCFWISLMFHAEPPISIFSLPALLIVVFLSSRQQKWLGFKTALLGLTAFLLPFTPLFLFDLRHDFIQLKAGLSFLAGDTRGLQEIAPLSFWQRLIDRPQTLLFAFQEAILNLPRILGLLVFIAMVYSLHRLKLKKFLLKFYQACLIYLLSLTAIFIVYPHQLKLFYLSGLQLLFIVWLAIVLSHLWRRPSFRKSILVYLALAIFLNLKPLNFISSAKNNFADRRRLGSLYLNQLEAIDWIYQDAAGQGFKAYIFVPPLYDFNYQYLFFWRGLNHHGYLPEEFSYAPHVPEYIPKKTQQLERLKAKIKPADNLVYLLIDNQGSVQEKSHWRAGLTELKLDLISQHHFPNGTIIEKYQSL